MLIEGKITLKAPIQKLWNSILDPNILAACVPGMESLELKGDKVYDGVMKQKVGPFSLKLKGNLNWVEFDPPKHLKGTIKGEALGGMGTAMSEITIDLAELQKDEVELTYKMSAMITGKLSVLGDRIMRAKAKSMEEEMTKNFQEKLV